MDRPGAVAGLRTTLAGFATTWLADASAWCVALSGGPDSLALTAAAAATLPTTALIVDHGLQPGSDLVAAAAADQARALGCVRAEVLRVQVGHVGGPEAAARTASALREDTDALDGLAADELPAARSGDGLDATAIRGLPAALRRRVIRAWLLAGGASGLTDPQIRAVDAVVIAWRGQGPVAVSSNLPRTRLLVQRRGALLTLHREPV